MSIERDQQLLTKYQAALTDANIGLLELVLETNTMNIDQGIRNLCAYEDDVQVVPFENFFTRVHPDDLSDAKEYVNQLKNPTYNPECLYRIISNDKKIKYIRTRAKQIKNKDGKLIALSALCWDVTNEVQLKKQKEDADSQHKLMMTLVDSSTDLFGYTDHTGVPIYVNNSGQEIYGIRAGKKHFIDYVSIKDQKYLNDVVVPILKSNKSWEGEVLAIHPETKTEIPIWIRIFSVKVGPTESDTYYACVGSDLRKLKAIQSSLLAQTRMAALGKMASDMAHEINNPLMIIQVKAQMLQDILRQGLVIENDKLNKDLQLIEKNSQRIQKIVHSSEVISRNAESDPYAEISILTLIDETYELCQEKFSKKNFKLDIIIASDVNYSDTIEARGSEILQVLVNLINNSFDAIQNNENGWTKLQIEKQENQFKIQVTDSGTKIPKDIVEKMMTPFFTTKPTDQGIGLGLSLSKQIVDNHQGQFFYDSSSENTKFVVILKMKIN